MIRRRFAAFAVAGLDPVSVSLCLSGCSVGLKDAYSLKERIPSIEASFAAEEEAAKGICFGSVCYFRCKVLLTRKM